MSEKEKKRRVSPWLTAAIIVVSAAIVFVAGKFIYSTFIDPMSAFEQTAAVTTPEPATQAPEATATPEPTLSPEEQLLSQADTDFMHNRVNILMLGWDESAERNDSSSELYRDEENNFRSDVIMLCTVDFDAGTVDLISVPRDTLAPIYKSDGTLYSETAHYKINAAFAKGGSAAGDGFAYAMTTISKLLGVPIDYYAGVNMEGLKAVVDAMGGVDYDVDVEIRLNGRVLETGYQHLNGQQVLDYCRARKGISTDVGRADRQQRMLFAIFAQLKSRDQIVNFPNVYLSVKDYIDTNLTFSQISALSAFALKLDMEDLGRHTLAGEYVNNTSYSNASYYVLYTDKLVELINGVFGITITPNPRIDAAYVLADKSAGIAQDYVAAAEYLFSITGVYYDEYTGTYTGGWNVDEIVSLMAQASSVSLRKLPDNLSDEERQKRLDTPLDAEACDAASSALHNALINYCAMYGITQAAVDKSMLPKTLYAALPVPIVYE